MKKIKLFLEKKIVKLKKKIKYFKYSNFLRNLIRHLRQKSNKHGITKTNRLSMQISSSPEVTSGTPHTLHVTEAMFKGSKQSGRLTR